MLYSICMTETCATKCPVIRECTTRVNGALERQKSLLATRRRLTEGAFQTISIVFGDTAPRPITYPADEPKLLRAKSELRRHEAVIAEIAAGATRVAFGQRECTAGPKPNIVGEALLSAATLMRALRIMHPQAYMYERAEITELYPRCTSTNAVAGLQQMPAGVSNPTV